MKTSKLLWVLLAVLLAVAFVGCSDSSEDGGGSYSNPRSSSTTLKTYYIKALDASREEGYKDISHAARLHFHLPKGSAFKIQKIFTSNTMSDGVPSNATVWYDFTMGSEDTDYEVGNYGGVIAAGTTTDGLWILDNSNGIGEVYPGNIGIALDAHAYFGFIMANVSDDAVFDNLQLEFYDEDDVSYLSKSAAYYFGFTNQPGGNEEGGDEEIDLTEWTPAYIEVENTEVNTIIIHTNGGSVEIQKILVNTTKSLEGAFTVLDFTLPDPKVNVYWTNLTAIEGRVVIELPEGDTYKRWDALGTAASYDNDAPVWIFIIRTTTEDKAGLGSCRVQFGADDDDYHPVVTFNEMEF
jgi:hypothetical protein